MPYDPEAYWTAHGPYLAPPDSSSPEQLLVLGVIRAKLHTLGPIESVLDVGCGQGRLAAVLGEELPLALYTGMDIGEAQIAGTSKVRPDGTFYLSSLQKFQSFEKWDLVICSEVLMHVPPADIELATGNLLALAGKWLITVDWTVPLGVDIASWNFLHDYQTLLQPDEVIPACLQSIFIKQM